MGHIMYRGVLWCFVGSMSFVYSCGIVIIIMYLYYNVRKGAGASKKEPEGLLLASYYRKLEKRPGPCPVKVKAIECGEILLNIKCNAISHKNGNVENILQNLNHWPLFNGILSTAGPPKRSEVNSVRPNISLPSVNVDGNSLMSDLWH